MIFSLLVRMNILSVLAFHHATVVAMGSAVDQTTELE